MRVSVFGLGYVGAVSAACLAAQGHHVIGVDVTRRKVDLVNKGASPVMEPGLSDLIADTVRRGTLKATIDPEFAVCESVASIICVPTPSRADGSADLHYIETVCQQIGKALRIKETFHVIIVRSTVPPGTVRNVVIPAIEVSGSTHLGEKFGLCINPEFLREGTAISDFVNPAKIVYGATDERASIALEELHSWLSGPRIRCPIETAEMVKTVDNAWHATKVVFANEVGSLCKRLHIDSHEVMRAFCADTKLNLSSSYLRPGFAFGGACLPKDLRSINHLAAELGLEVPLLGSLAISNQQQIQRGYDMILGSGKRSIGFIGVSFKENTDDLRESPLLELIKRLIQSDLEVRIYDPNVNVNKSNFIPREAIPDVAQLVVNTLDELLAHAELVVIGHGVGGRIDALAERLRPYHQVVDFVRIPTVEAAHKNYEGICW